MCGRYTLTLALDDLAEVFGEALPGLEHVPRYNVAPTDVVPVLSLSRDREAPVLGPMRWGLVPFWADDPSLGSRMINARSESVADKPAFRRSFERRRCLVPADGFYEWERLEGGGKQPWWIHRSDGAPFTFAGLWDRWRPPGGGEPLLSFTILTTRPNGVVRPLHDRMPVVVEPSARRRWLDPSTPTGALEPLLGPPPDEGLEARPVSPRVNRPGNDDPSCIEPAD